MDVECRSDAEVYTTYGRALVAFATGLVGPTDAQDVVSNALMRVMSSPVWVEAVNQRALLYRGVVYEARSWRRAAARRRRRDLHAVGPAAAYPPEPQPEVWSAIGRLSPQQRAVVFLTYWEDLDPAGVAELLAVSEGTVRKQLARARERLRKVL